MAKKQEPKIPVTVLGAGVTGLTTACILQNRGYQVTVVSRAFPGNPDVDPIYTSPAAGAHWRSYAANDDYRGQEWDELTFQTLLRLCSVPGTGLMIAPGYEFWAEKPDVWQDPFFARFIPKYQRLEAEALPQGCKFGISYETVCINVPKYLPWLLDQFLYLGGKTEERDVSHIDELFQGKHAANVVVNCTGFGARTLPGVADGHVYPTRGQIVQVFAPHVRHTVTRLGTMHEDFTYIIPRDDGIVVLGGTYQADNHSLEADPKTADDIIERCLAICPELKPEGKSLEIVAHKVGLRPTRVGGTRCEAEWRELDNGRKVLLVHSYGHGGYGYQSSYGSAATVTKIVDSELAQQRASARAASNGAAAGRGRGGNAKL
ncbi:D-amino-acid oxidase [Fimicolochytrium jonesii]|uniref:D-amino-acid oxidase n=1 Tax=Fimicolochytrium jonesii TaxID=1396493 RepID=UPI0022FF23CA|nr:D-amino-acid oxidase [Fimicolochytrium jonesii]KAI8818528.1 D-amino-acid oxidase [Fimicolochytrium jonesii]